MTKPIKPLVLPVRKKWFEQIKSGQKAFEYREFNEFWVKRLVAREFSKVVITLGYPKRTDTERRLEFPWRGYDVDRIQSSEFGNEPIAVFAIRLEK